MGLVVGGVGYAPAFLATGASLLVLAVFALRLAPAFNSVERARAP